MDLVQRERGKDDKFALRRVRDRLEKRQTRSLLLKQGWLLEGLVTMVSEFKTGVSEKSRKSKSTPGKKEMSSAQS